MVERVGQASRQHRSGEASIIYPAVRAVEHATAVPGVRPSRIFSVLWPLWQVETTAQIQEEQDYEMLDRFLVRGLMEGGFTRITELCRFYGLPRSLVDRCLAFLFLIGHVVVADEVVTLTPLGLDSVRAGIRYVTKESRQKLLVERFTSSPLPRRHYDGSLTVLTTPRVPPEQGGDRLRFKPLFAPMVFQPDIIAQLAQRPDRHEFNLPKRMRDLQVLGAQDAYLPAYLIACADQRLLAYSGVAGERDTFLEQVCNQLPMIGHLVAAERTEDPQTIWTRWLADSKLKGTLRQLPNGTWRATLATDSFGDPPRLSRAQVGSYRLSKGCFLQLWSNDTGLRRRAAMERVLSMTKSHGMIGDRADLVAHTASLAERLEVPAPTLKELRRHAHQHGLTDALARLDELD
ncbi:hypothetical protein [Micromonospora sp. WMMD987]|uniref:hypothetical protein n=1 Tax=Micromonospora sp. WMMD987 TaxID=3016089 RepID=UPI002499EC23|nr:hypothetical protein [Micromonospora sp. WMMD987]WFE96497.1 hypothetical protein O7612_06260 [Micromonospora sp. WMMD987]